MAETPMASKRPLKRKGIHSVRGSHVDRSPDNGDSISCVCKNSACQATMSTDDTFCKRCSCCICKKYDDNKDPSRWFVCTSESGDEESCGLSSHLECALQSGKVGINGHGQSMNLDGSYCCAFCGKMSLILGCWKKQLMIAKDARRVDVLCERISLSYRLLEGTLKFQELHEVVEDVMSKLERELGPVNEVSGKMSRGGIVTRLPIAGEVQHLCALAIEKADEWLAALSSTDLHQRACRFRFEEITSSSIAIVLIEPSVALSADMKGYKIWYCKSRNEAYSEEPIYMFSRSQKTMLISNLQPLTEYSCKIASYSETGDVTLFEAKCFTKSANKSPSSDSKAPTSRRSHASCELDLNVAAMPDLNEEITPHFRDNEKISLRSVGSGVLTNGNMPAVNSRGGLCQERAVITIDDTNESGSMLNGSPLGISKTSGDLDFNFDHSVKVICKLECDGHIKEEFRKKFLTWFSLRSTEHEKRVVKTFIQFIDDSSSLAAQLVDTFSDLVNFKKPHNGC